MTVKKAPPNRKNASTRYEPLIDAAFKEPGEWFSVPSESSASTNVYTELFRKVGMRVAEVSVIDEEVYLRVLT